MGTTRKVLVTGLLSVVLAIVAAPAASAAPATGCDAVVVDGAHMLGNGKDVARAAAAVAKHHATVRVRTWPSVRDADLDAAVAAEVRRCASWHDRSARKRADLVVLAVSLHDRKTGIYYGSGWTAALDDQQEAVQTGAVNPLLRRAKYTAAVTAGLTAVERLLPARPGQAPAASAPAGDGASVPDDTSLSVGDLDGDESSDSSGTSGGAIFGVLAVLGVLAVVASSVFGATSGGRSGGRSRSWTRSTGYTSGFMGGSDSGFSGSSGFSGGSDAGSSSSSSPSSDGGGGSSTSW